MPLRHARTKEHTKKLKLQMRAIVRQAAPSGLKVVHLESQSLKLPLICLGLCVTQHFTTALTLDRHHSVCGRLRSSWHCSAPGHVALGGSHIHYAVTSNAGQQLMEVSHHLLSETLKMKLA